MTTGSVASTACSPHQIVELLAAENPEAIAVVDPSGRWTFRELRFETLRLAADLRRAGLRTGQRLVYAGRNSSELLLALFATSLVGATFVPVNWRLTSNELEKVLMDADPTLVVAAPEFREALSATESLGGRLPLSVRSADVWVLDEAQCCRSAHPVQIYTSGTTGVPKGVMLTAGNFDAVFKGATTAWGISSRSVALVCLPLFHVGGLAFALMVLRAGGRVVLMPEFEPERFLEIAAEERATTTLVVPTILQMLLDVKPSHRGLQSLEQIIYGGAPMPLDLIRRVREETEAGLLQSYAMTETTGHLSYLSTQDHYSLDVARLQSVGAPYPWVDVKIIEPASGEDQAPSHVGEIWVKTPTATPGYWNNSTETARLLTHDGWLRTGDLGLLDESGYLHLRGRLKELIISGGENVSPGEVEQVLGRYPGVAEVAVFGVPDAMWGERVEAALVMRPGHAANLNEIFAFARNSLASFKVPRRLHVVKHLPRNSMGKLQRHVLTAGGN